MRIKSEIWVRAYLRRCQSDGVPVVIVRRGDEAAGAIFICVDRLDGTVCSLWTGARRTDGKRRRAAVGDVPRIARRQRGGSRPVSRPAAGVRLRSVDYRDRGWSRPAFFGRCCGQGVSCAQGEAVRGSLTLPSS